MRDDHISHSFADAKDVINPRRFKFSESKPLGELMVMQSHSMLQFRFLHGALLTCVLGLPCAVHAQETSTTAPLPSESSTTPTELTEPSALEWSLLSPEIPLTTDTSGKFRARTMSSGETMSWDRTDKGDGGSAMTVKQSVLPFADAKVGADLNVASQMPGTSADALAGKLNGSSYQSTGSAWANMTAPGLGNVWDKTTIEARVDPTQEQSRINTSISKSVPLGSQQYSLTAQTGYNVIQSAVPMISANGRVTKGATEVDRSAKLEFKDTGTSVMAGETISTMDEKWLRRVGVEQKVFGGVSVTGSVSETQLGTPNRSLTAGFKHSW